MPEAPKGKWEVIMSGNCPLDSQQEAVHECVIYNPHNDKWEILYFPAIERKALVISY